MFGTKKTFRYQLCKLFFAYGVIILAFAGSRAQETPPPETTEAPEQAPPPITSGEGFHVHIDGIEPESGPTYGETRVIVRGRPFGPEMEALYPHP